MDLLKPFNSDRILEIGIRLLKITRIIIKIFRRKLNKCWLFVCFYFIIFLQIIILSLILIKPNILKFGPLTLTHIIGENKKKKKVQSYFFTQQFIQLLHEKELFWEDGEKCSLINLGM